jgi:hypothetical protein
MFTVAKALVQNIVYRHGAPRKILSDRGKEFRNGLIAAICELMGISRAFTSPYKPSTDGLVESLNGQLVTQLRILCNEGDIRWDENQFSVTFAHNSMISSATGYSPFFLVHGREPRISLDVTLGLDTLLKKKTPKGVRAFVKEMREKQIEAYAKVGVNLERSRQKNQIAADKRGSLNDTYKVGDLVFKSIRGHGKLSRKKKLEPKYDGPWIIVERIPLTGTFQLRHRDNPSRPARGKEIP